MSDRIQNVVLVVVDALRRDRVSAYDQGPDLTPNLADLASEGMVFENAFTCTNTTDPSVTSMHTGRDPETVVKHHGPFVTDAEKRRAESVAVVPEILRDRGHRTVVTGRTLGRWHRRGFDYYPEESFGRYQRRSVGKLLERISPALRNLAGAIYDRYAAATASSTDAVDTLLNEIDNGPFYGLVHLMDTHVPYSYDSDRVAEYLEHFNYPQADLKTFFKKHTDNEYVDQTMREYSEKRDYEVGIARWFAKYDAAVSKTDRKIGKLIDGLSSHGLLEDTVIIVTSDHGESLDEHGIYFDHHGLYDPQIRVPLVVFGPGISATRSDEFVQLYDLAPTILDLAGYEADLDADGQSLSPLLGDSDGWASRNWVVAQEAHAQRRLAIRTRNYKFITHEPDEVLEGERGDSFRCGYCDTVHGAEQELYNLIEDPSETQNIAGAEPDTIQSLEDQLDAYFEDKLPVGGREGDVEYEGEDDLFERLEDLGYH